MKNRLEEGTAKGSKEGDKDFVKVFVQRAGKTGFEPFFSRRTPLRLNGHTVTVFGRTERGASDRNVEACEVIFRKIDDLEQIYDCDASITCSRMRVQEKVPDIGRVRRHIATKISEHPCIKVDEKKFIEVLSHRV
ncbi:MAG: hypothetical protein NTW66_00250 [Candidatus Magasanikbacteria bacterium]|nr:hypothetical protein [Candidatus Magasanikbacteria bacterium]